MNQEDELYDDIKLDNEIDNDNNKTNQELLKLNN